MHEADPKDLISFLLETLHQELNKANNAPYQNSGYNLNEADSYDENKAIQNFINDFTKNNKSIISDTFFDQFVSLKNVTVVKKLNILLRH